MGRHVRGNLRLALLDLGLHLGVELFEVPVEPRLKGPYHTADAGLKGGDPLGVARLIGLNPVLGLLSEFIDPAVDFGKLVFKLVDGR